MKLFNFAWGPYPRRLSIYLAEKGIEGIERVAVEFPHRPELWPEEFLRKLNPAHALPVLALSEGFSIRQSLAILEYLEETSAAGASLIGRTARERAATREFVAVFDEATTFLGLWARHGSAVNRGRHPVSLEAAAIGAERYASRLRVAEGMIGDTEFLGEALSIADCVAMALLEFAEGFYGVPIPADCPKLAAWYGRFSVRPSVQGLVYPEAMRQAAHGLPEQTGCVF